ncbi:serine/threonine-protein kinase AtPK2/AtPK19-like [Primulina huaijiensis]|uniref:serine/threonine-protein kinase AtPK2/AtPK19-like n=1 Tax=Primulina huaijiensis TaxID=1492673 RepID=UPI003CC73C05
MVASQQSMVAGTKLLMPLQNHLLQTTEALDALSLDDLDFSDVFGPAPTLTTLAQISEDSEDFDVLSKVTQSLQNEPEVIYRRSHSFVGPTTHASQSMKIGNFTLHEKEDSLAHKDEIDENALEEFLESCPENNVLEKSMFQVDGDSVKTIGFEDFEILKVVGQGAFGKVYQVRKTGSSEILAMKVMRKDKIVEKNHEEYMKAERDIMTKIEHPFIIQLRYSFQTKYRLYLILDFVNGGHLFFQLHHHGLFREDLARIYTAEMVSAVAHLHMNGIMHRDLKPENILLDSEGHAMLTDFGLAKQFDDKTRSNSMCGTLEYMAPEIVIGKGHDKAADWWSLGIILYEMLTGKPPFCGNRQKIQQKILKDKIKLPSFLSSDAHSLLKGLLQKDASKRLGSGQKGGDEIKGHKWFASINWKKLEAREIQPGFLPQVAGKHCIANFDERWTKMPLLDSPAASPKSEENPFKGFSYEKPTAPFLRMNL